MAKIKSKESKGNIYRVDSLIQKITSEKELLEQHLSDLIEERDLVVEDENLFSERSEALPELIVKKGETRSIVQRTYRFSRLVVEKGGTLKIRGSANMWCIVHCEREVKIYGEIIGNGLPIGQTPIEATTPSGFFLSHSFNNRARGGNGGIGGPAHHWNNRRAQGGRGARGTESYGGGGGGGAGATLSRRTNRPAAYPGGDAAGQAGGHPGQLGSASGGDGGRQNRFGNGSLLYIHCESFDGKNATINLEGVDGQNGQNGDRGSYQRNGWFSTGAGGGGGGAPGGDGGVLVVEAKSVLNYPNMLLSGGKGGAGGNGGSGSWPPGQDGRNGENGESGYVDWIISSAV